MRIVYLNGNYLPLDAAHISVMDRGFLFGDGVYEVIPIYAGHFFCYAQHLKRLQASLDAIQIAYPVDLPAWKNILQELLTRNHAENTDQIAYIQVTRGAPQDRTHAFPEEVPQPTQFAQVTPLATFTPETLRQIKATAITAQDTRWNCCFIKSINLLPNILFSQQAHRTGAKEAILIHDNQVIEGSPGISIDRFFGQEGRAGQGIAFGDRSDRV